MSTGHGRRRGWFAPPADKTPAGGATGRAAAPSRGAERPADLEDVVAEARRSFDKDPNSAISNLEHLRRDHAPDPVVLHALCLMHQRNGDIARAVEVAREAFPICFRRGLGFLAAEIFDVLEADAHALGLGRDELMALGGALGRTVYWRLGFRALASVLMSNPDDEAAFSELLRMAEYQAKQLRDPAEALNIYGFLATLALDAERQRVVERGVEDAEEALGLLAGQV